MQRSLIIALLFTFLLTSEVAPSHANNNGNGAVKTRVAAEYCSAGVYNYGGCCCAVRDKLPLTVTKTLTMMTPKAASTTIASNGHRRDVEHINDSILLRRNLCPRCPPLGSKPISVKTAKAKGIPESKANMCCPRRKIVTKTVIKGKKATIRGRLWIDVDKNNRYNSPPDKPLANTLISFYALPNKKRQTQRLIGTGSTDNTGRFSSLVTPQAPGTQINIYESSNNAGNNDPLLTVVAEAGGGAEAPIPIAYPPKPTANSVVLASNIGTVTGKGKAGYTISLYVNDTLTATTHCKSDASYSVSTPAQKLLTSGTWNFTVAMTTNQGILSDLVNAGTDSILPPPIITRVTYQNNAQKVTVQAKAAPSALFYVFSKNVRISTCQANATGSVSDCGSEAFNLTYPAKLQVTQSNEKGTSDMSQTFVAEFPDPKIKGAGILPNSKRITAHGTAYPESVLLVYGNTTLLGTCDVDPDGIWSFVTDTDQKPGVYAIKVSQTFNIGSLGLHKEAEGPSVTVPTAPIKTRTTSLTKTSRTRTTSTLTKSLTRTATTTKVEIIDVNAHNLVSCATWNNGRVRCWGQNSYFSTGSADSFPWPSFGAKHAWGMQDAGVILFENGTWAATAPLSHNETAAPSNLAPAQYRLLAPCANAIIATLTNGTLLGWGGFSDYLGPRNETVIPVGLQGRGGEIKELVCGAYNPVAVLNDGSFFLWGGREHGVQDSPADVTLIDTACVGEFHVCAVLKSNGSVVCWGDDRVTFTVPDDITGRVQKLACNDGYTLALLTNNTVVGWGAPGALSSPPNVVSDIPAVIRSGTLDIKILYAADGFAGVVLQNDTIILWGNNLADSIASMPPELGYYIGYI